MRALFALSMSLLLALPVFAQSTTSATSAAASSSKSQSTASTTSSRASSSSSSGPTIHRVNVGIGGHSYDPNTTYAAEGDIVQFVFYPTNHSVIRAEYAGSDACGGSGCNPCVPYDTIHGTGGFHSQNFLTQTTPRLTSIDDSTKVWNYTVTNASEPVFYYCNALASCANNGMVGVINPNEAVSLDKQKQAAIKAPFQLAPGEAWPAEGAIGAETASASGSSRPTATSANNGTASASHHNSLSGGAIAGIVIGGIVVLAVAAALFYFMGRSKTYKDMFKASRGGSEGAPGMSEVGDRVGPWSPGPHGQVTAPYQDNPSVTSPGRGYQDHRISHMTYNSQAPSDVGTFVGYNRNTGEPEFAAEAPSDAPGAQYSAHSSPAPKQGGFHPPPPPFQPSAPIPEQYQVHEAPGDMPRKSEKP